MSAFNIGRRYGLFGWRQAAELTTLGKHVRHMAFQPRQQFPVPGFPTFQFGPFHQGLLSTFPQRLHPKRPLSAAHLCPRNSLQAEGFLPNFRRRAIGTMKLWGAPNVPIVNLLSKILQQPTYKNIEADGRNATEGRCITRPTQEGRHNYEHSHPITRKWWRWPVDFQWVVASFG